MEVEIVIGKRVQAVDQLGHWLSAVVVDEVEGKWVVAFPGYPGCERTVAGGEIRIPVLRGTLGNFVN